MPKIFIADDEHPWLQLAISALSPFGEVKAVTHIADVFDTITTPLYMDDPDEHEFDLIVLDNNMQVSGAGIQALCEMRELGDKTPVIIHSSDLTPMDEQKLAKYNGVFVRKKIDCKKLITMVQEILAAK